MFFHFKCPTLVRTVTSFHRSVLRRASTSDYVNRVRLFDYWQQNDHALEAEFEHSKAVLMIDKEPLVTLPEHSMELVQFEIPDLRARLNLFGLDLHPAINSCLVSLAEPTAEHKDYRPIFGVTIQTLEPQVKIFSFSPADSKIDVRQLRRDLASTLGGKFQNLRMAMLNLQSEHDRFLLARFQTLTRWYMVFRRCPTCTSPLRVRISKWAARCIRCERDFYPTLSPVAICLVHDEENENCLLVRHRNSVPTVFTNVAGFASLGESLQETVRREVAEEVGIDVANVRALNLSQPWPIPFSSLMCGFMATADPKTPIQICEDELETARWFSRAEVRSALERTESDPFLTEAMKMSREAHSDRKSEVDPCAFRYVPPHGAIAHQMIKSFVHKLHFYESENYEKIIRQMTPKSRVCFGLF